MSLLTIEVVKVGQVVTEMGKNKKPYKLFELIYKNMSFEGKVETKKIMSFTPLFETLSQASSGDVFNINREKDDNGYWQWLEFADGESTETSQPKKSAVPAYVGTGKSVPASGGTYPTKEERLWIQTQIVRQSSLTTAANMLKTDKTTVTLDEVLPVAAQLEQWVIRKDAMKEILDMEDDVPM